MKTKSKIEVTPKIDKVLTHIADYVLDYTITSEEAYRTARSCLADSIGCAILALRFKECTKLLGPVMPGTVVPNGCRILGTPYVMDPIQGAFDMGAMIRWLDYNDTWLGAEWAHPSDNLGGLLAVADAHSRWLVSEGKEPLTVLDLLTAMIKAHEIQGIIALENSFNKVGLDHVILVTVATAAITTALMGGTREQVINAVSNAWVDVGSLRAYRHTPNTGSRKSWAAGDATCRGVMLALFALKGEMGYHKALTAKKWGLYDVVFNGRPFSFSRPYSTYVMENILFKIAFPAEFHAQTAVECAIRLHSEVNFRISSITRIEIETQEPAMLIIDKTGPLHNPADRDHCLQYMVAIALLFGTLNSDHYEDNFAKDPRIDALREKMVVKENPQFTADYLDPEKRSIANRITIFFENDTKLGPVTVEYPLGHRKRRQEGMPLLFEKFENNLKTRFSKKRVKEILEAFQDPGSLESTPIPEFMELFLES